MNGRGGRRQSWSRQRPTERARNADPAREAAFQTLFAVAEEDAYANLFLPKVLRDSNVHGRDAALATELSYGTLRAQGRYDAILARCVSRPLAELDLAVLVLLRLGTHQLLATRIPPHAAVSQTVALARSTVGAGAAGMVNAVLRKVSANDLDGWLAEVTAELSPDDALAVTSSHPAWVIRALRQSLRADRPDDQLEDLLDADNQPPAVTLVAQPGLLSRDELIEQVTAAGGTAVPGRWTPWSVQVSGVDPSVLPAVRARLARVQDEGSQLVVAALAGAAPIQQGEHWLDLCAGPGGKTALLAALGAPHQVRIDAVDPAPHRAELVRKSLPGPLRDLVDVQVGDGREVTGSYDRVLVDAPCTGLGALRRRPEARWRRQPADVGALRPLQAELLTAALAATRPGGLVAYSTCSPHLAETRDIVAAAPGATVVDLREGLPKELPLTGPSMQLWPHVHGTDAMFCAVLRKD